jgi:ssDNA-binding replication factor A large subunit
LDSDFDVSSIISKVNFWNNRRALNINRPTRVTVLKEGGQPVTKISDEPVSIADAGTAEGIVSVVARILPKKDDQIVKKDGSGTLDIVRGRLADPSGTIGFISWREFNHEVDSLVKIDRAQVRRFRETPEINIGDLTKIEPFHCRGRDLGQIANLGPGLAQIAQPVRMAEICLGNFV